MSKDGSKSGQIRNDAGIPEEFLKPYQPQSEESAMYALWEKSGVFVADPESKKEHFSISMPPR